MERSNDVGTIKHGRTEMKRLHLDGKVLKGMDGNPILDSNESDGMVSLGAQISELLGISRGAKDPVKCYELALRFRNDKSIELDTSDLDLVREEINKADASNLLKAQLLLLLKEAKEDVVDEVAEAKQKRSTS